MTLYHLFYSYLSSSIISPLFFYGQKIFNACREKSQKICQCCRTGQFCSGSNFNSSGTLYQINEFALPCIFFLFFVGGGGYLISNSIAFYFIYQITLLRLNIFSCETAKKPNFP